MSFRAENRAYEKWFMKQCDVVKTDLAYATPNFVSPLRAGKSKRTRTLLKPSIAGPAATVIPP